MRILFVLILGLMTFLGHAWAQEESVMKATSALQDVLSNLQESVTKLSLDNDHLATKDHTIKNQLQELNAQLGSLVAQGDLLNVTASKLKDINPRRADQIERLEEQSIDLNHRVQKAQEGIKFMEKSLSDEYQIDQKLLLRLKGMQNRALVLGPVQSPESKAQAHRQKEKLKLMKMIYESEQRQEALHQSMLELQKNKPLLPAANALAQQQLLKEQVNDVETQLAAYREKALRSNGPLNQWDTTQMRQLELELKVLERNYAQFKGLMEQMTKKVQNTKITADQHAEEGKITGNIGNLNRQAVSLRADLDDLRSQMVELDKRKSRLEMMLQHSR